jgi:hypothetical protein
VQGLLKHFPSKIRNQCKSATPQATGIFILFFKYLYRQRLRKVRSGPRQCPKILDFVMGLLGEKLSLPRDDSRSKMPLPNKGFIIGLPD